MRSDLPAKELRIYFNGLKFKNIRVPVQRLCVLLAVKDQGQPAFLMKCATDEKTSEPMKMNDTDEDAIEDIVGGETIEEADAFYNTAKDFDKVRLGDALPVSAMNMLDKATGPQLIRGRKSM